MISQKLLVIFHPSILHASSSMTTSGAGLNFLRIPIAFWAIETWPGEPYFTRTSWKQVPSPILRYISNPFGRYFLRVLNWARKYGLRVCLDLHAVPGSQNGMCVVHSNISKQTHDQLIKVITILESALFLTPYRRSATKKG